VTRELSSCQVNTLISTLACSHGTCPRPRYSLRTRLREHVRSVASSLRLNCLHNLFASDTVGRSFQEPDSFQMTWASAVATIGWCYDCPSARLSVPCLDNC
jgi:hypothetical protein